MTETQWDIHGGNSDHGDISVRRMVVMARGGSINLITTIMMIPSLMKGEGAMTMIPTTGIIMTPTDVTMKIGNCFMTMEGTIIIMTVNAAIDMITIKVAV